MSATYARLRSGEWGIKSTVALRAGDTAVVVKRSGQARRVIIGRVLWTGNDGACLATIAQAAPTTRRQARVAQATADVEQTISERIVVGGLSAVRAYVEQTRDVEREPETVEDSYAPANDDGRFADEWEGVGS
jgi:hypothetical protein